MYKFTINFFNGQTESVESDSMVIESLAYTFQLFRTDNTPLTIKTVPSHSIRSIDHEFILKDVTNSIIKRIKTNQDQPKRE